MASETTWTTARGRRPLQSLNFFMADMQAGIGPFLGVFLLAHGWRSGLIGSVMDDRRGRRHADDGPGRSAGRRHGPKAPLRRRSGHLHGAGLDPDPAVPAVLARRGPRRWRPPSRVPPSARPSPASRSAWCASAASTSRTAATRPSTTPATWSGPGCRASSAGDSASPPCSGWPPAFGVLSIASVLMIPRGRHRRRGGARPRKGRQGRRDGRRPRGAAAVEAAARPGRGARLLPPRQRCHAAPLRTRRRGRQGRRPLRVRRHHDRRWRRP